MTIIERVKHLTGAALSIEVDLPQRFLPAGSVLPFNLTLNSEIDVVVRTLTMEVSSSAEAPGTPGWESAEAVCAAEPLSDLTIEGGKPYHHSGAIQLPEVMSPTVNDRKDARYWSFRVKADVPNGIDPSVSVGFVIGPAYQFAWETSKPVEVSILGQRRIATARGSCTIVQPDEDTHHAARQFLQEAIPRALSELLHDRDGYVRELVEGQRLHELAGTLREIVTPSLRATNAVALDSVLELSVEAIELQEGGQVTGAGQSERKLV